MGRHKPYPTSEAPARMRARIAAHAEAIVRSNGLSALTCQALGRALHLRPATINRYFRDLEEIRDGVSVRAAAELMELAENVTAGLAGREALRALFEAQRLYAQARPHMYEAAMRTPAARGPAPAVGEDFLDLERRVLGSCGVPKVEAARLAWCFRAALHGAIRLEASDRLRSQTEIDQNFERLLQLLEAAADLYAAGGRSASPAEAAHQTAEPAPN